jgi:hypothetical protein
MFFRPGIRAALALVGCAVLAPQVLTAQRGRASLLQVERTSSAQLGLRAIYSTQGNQDWGYGAQARLPLDWNLSAEPSVDVFSRNGTSTWQANADLLALDRRGWLYVRFGLAMLKQPNIDLKYGVNAGIGTDFPFLLETPLRPFAEARWSVVDGRSPLRVLLGMNFVLGHR